ncbi:sprT-like domain-containing protein Spartan [Xenopus tropicalis]|uniref:SprT-like domain-containing protein Spartan n=1 Tax=Xenopus tropicalis TaxID=8364 RepID=A0A8J1IT72_XENTR|nr:sprT-like domain-containing protein Spartan [Xenopus tropicalis]
MGLFLSTSDSSSEYYTAPNSPDLSFNNQSNENFTSWAHEKHSVACQTDLSFQTDLSVVDPYWEVLDPKPDIHVLFEEFNAKFFGGQLPPIELKWSNRLCIDTGVFIHDDKTGICKIHLNKPLLDLRARKDTVQTLLHEMIHYYQRLRGTHDLEHGATFQYHMKRINRESGANITIYHDFIQEYESLKRHWWKCNGPCQQVVKRLMNRTPGTKAHKRKCGGDFIKIQEPENKRMRTDP